ncbi:MAG: metalloprotease TldD [Gammaproteobacteria bacterium]|nr:metalloprotease TldD [Gammaproteobacteria bacterium]
MTETAAQAHRDLLELAQLTDDDLSTNVDTMLSRQIDDAELFIQHSRSESWALEDGKVKDGRFAVSQGVGVRAITGEKTGFAHTNELNDRALRKACLMASSIADRGGNRVAQIPSDLPFKRVYEGGDPTANISNDEKVRLLSELDRYTRGLDHRIAEVSVNLRGSTERALVYASDGTNQFDDRPLVSCRIHVIVKDGNRTESGTDGGGGRYPLDVFFADDFAKAKAMARESVRMAITKLDSVAAPAGEMPVVLGPGWAGVLLHEAVGHGLEGDCERKQTSCFAGKIGEKVASELCTVIDDATIEGRRGSLSMDDEGTPGQRTVLIEDGILRGFMWDKHNAILTGNQSTGNGRRESFACMTIPRMTNTFMLAGDSDPEDIVRSVNKGVYCSSFSGGSVDPTSGRFVFATTEAYLIENGKLTSPIHGCMLTGYPWDVMNSISMVGSDFALDAGIGTCGKQGQGVPVGLGQPTLKVEKITVGGTTA